MIRTVTKTRACRFATPFALAALVAFGIPPTLAHAEPAAAAGDEGRALATDLFDSGVKKMERGRCTTPPVDAKVCLSARDDFRRAFAAFPAGLGALRNLAHVEKGLGLVASASHDFRELARRAPLDPNPVRRPWAEFARREADALDARVPKLKTDVVAPVAPQTTVTLDGVAVPEAAWGAEMPVDPGKHVLRVEAPGRAPFETTFTLAEQEVHVETVALEPAPIAANDEARTQPVAAPSEAKGSRLLPIVVASVGLAATGAGLVLGGLAIKKHGEACNAANLCEPDGLASGRSLAQTSTIVTSIGAGVLAVGVVWYLLAPSGAAASSGAVSHPPQTAVLPFFTAGGGGLVTTRAF